MIVVLISLVLLLSAIIYNYVKKVSASAAGTAEQEAKKLKVVGGLAITSAVVLLISFVISIWGTTIGAKTANVCLNPVVPGRS